MTLIQNVINSGQKVTKKISKKFLLNVRLLLLTSGRKNYTSISRTNDISYNSVYITSKEADDYIEYSRNILINLINNLSIDNNGILLIDFTLISKRFSQHIQDVTYDYDGNTKRIEKGLSVGFAIWSNGKVNVPFDFIKWLRKKDSVDAYKSKSKLVQELILSIERKIPISEILLDGAFASKEMINFFIEQKMNFTIRIPCNRVIEIDDNSFQLRDCSQLKFKRNEKFKTVYAAYKGFNLFFTAHKRKSKKGSYETVYIVSNVKRKPKEHIFAYNKRWTQEKFHRTSKQHLGLAHCQSTKVNKQDAHIFLIMYSYALLQVMKFDKKKKSVEVILHYIRCQKFKYQSHQSSHFGGTFMI